MKNVSFHHLALIFCFLLLFSCKKDNPVACSTAWASELQNEFSAISTAVTVYTLDQSEANCNALKAAYQDYIDALKPFGNCATLTGQDRTEWVNTINEAEANLDTIC